MHIDCNIGGCWCKVNNILKKIFQRQQKYARLCRVSINRSEGMQKKLKHTLYMILAYNNFVNILIALVKDFLDNFKVRVIFVNASLLWS